MMGKVVWVYSQLFQVYGEMNKFDVGIVEHL